MRLMRVKRHFLELIRSGKKTLEVRVGYPNIRTIQPGERIRLASRTESLIIRVKDVRVYTSLDEMLSAEKVQDIAPGQSDTQISKLLRDIYPPHLEKKGVYVLEITPD
jgi:ASC-1-like (ASCH) protein